MKKSGKATVENLNKPKRKHSQTFNILSGILAIGMVLSGAWMIYRLIILNFLSQVKLYFIIGAICFIIAVLCIALFCFCRKKSIKILISTLSVLCIAICSIGGFYIHLTGLTVDTVTNRYEELHSKVVIYVLRDGTVHSLESLNGKEVGVLKDIGISSTQACLDELETSGITVSKKEYDSLESLINALLQREVPAIVVSGAKSTFNSVMDLENDAFKTFEDDTKIIYEYQITLANNPSTVRVDDVTYDPYTVMLTGMDSRNGFDEISRSDVNMIAAINPQTHIVLIVSIPRDYYVETVCDPAVGCMNGQSDKLTHTGFYGTETTKSTIEHFLGLNLNYTVQVNFTSVVNLVDALGGIEVNVAEGYAVPEFYTNRAYGVIEGQNYLNGEAALAYARERYAYAEGDHQRIRNQQQVLLSIINKAISPAVITNYPLLLDALAGAFNTDITSDEIQSLIQYQIDEGPQWTFLTYSLGGESQMVFSPELGQEASMIIPDQSTIQAAKEKIQAVLDGKSVVEIEAIQAPEPVVEQIEQPVEEIPVEETPIQEYIDPGYYDPYYYDYYGYDSGEYYDPDYYYDYSYDYGYDYNYWGGYYDEYGNWIPTQ